MEKFTPTIITSRKAKKHLELIKSRHSEITQGMSMQAEKVRMWNEQKKAEAFQNQQVQNEQRNVKSEQDASSRKEQMIQENQIKKEQMAHEKEKMAHEMKMAELALKRKALEQPTEK